MELVKWEPFESLNRIQAQLNDLFDDGALRAWTYANGIKGAWLPPVDVLESKDAYLIRAELPGMKKEDFNLEMHDGTLTLSGERKLDKPADGVDYHRTERLSGKFSRSFTLPHKVQQDAIAASYSDGILEIHVPKADEAKPRQIEIN